MYNLTMLGNRLDVDVKKWIRKPMNHDYKRSIIEGTEREIELRDGEYWVSTIYFIMFMSDISPQFKNMIQERVRSFKK